MTRAELVEKMARAMSDQDEMHVHPQIWHFDYATAALAAIEAAGWVCVPREATERMLDATNGFQVGCCSVSTSDAAELWGDMLAASPLAPEPGA